MEKLSRRSFLKGAAGVAASASSLGAVDFIGENNLLPNSIEGSMSVSHFGAFHPIVKNGRLEGVIPFKGDESPSSMLNGVVARTYAPDRIKNPSVRKSVLEKGFEKAPKSLRGKEEFVEITWEKAYELVANELKRVYEKYGSNAVYGGNYGWHGVGGVGNPQTLIYRMLNITGGYTARVLSYSCHCIGAITPHIVGVDESAAQVTSWDNVLEHSKVIVMWSADILTTNQIHHPNWFVGMHRTNKYIQRLKELIKEGKIRVINIDPVVNHTARFLGAEQVFINPTTDVALVEAMCYHLIKNNLHDEKFLKKYTVGFAKLKERLFDENNPKTPELAEKITGIKAEKIKELAELMAKNRTMIMAGWGFQRAHHGEQAHWAMITLASVLGQIGLDGGGYGFHYHDADAGADNSVSLGNAKPEYTSPGLLGIGAVPSIKGEWSDRENEVIPVSRIVDMLENPGKEYDFNGKKKVFPNIKCIYWAGGNPMHHHQDRNRMLKAFEKVDSFIMQEIFWTASARHADLVLPATTEIERNDITKAHTNKYIFAMKECIKPMYNSRND
ncbi:molybdopterin-dependent oxidoreductase, partial [Campylobacter sp. 2018MI01]|uniref:molybdopterin-dependent oxidoreductase n=1 Tax=Campylobacter sp. 2018MI01 TaxID=2836735 RepID=UPI001BDA024B